MCSHIINLSVGETCRAPLKIVGEVTDWVRLTSEELQQWREKIANIKADSAAKIIN
jgi:hypothetical protein